MVSTGLLSLEQTNETEKIVNEKDRSISEGWTDRRSNACADRQTDRQTDRRKKQTDIKRENRDKQRNIKTNRQYENKPFLADTK